MNGRGPRTERGARLLHAAQLLTDRGFRAFPVLVAGTAKTPMISGYPGGTPFTAAELASMPWDRASHVGVAFGPHQLALDIDVKRGMQGSQHLAALVAAYGPLPRTLRQVTRSGGWHLLFSRRLLGSGTKLRSKAVLPDGTVSDIDIVRGGHRYLVIYDLDPWLTGSTDWPELPPAWHAAVVKVPACARGVATTRSHLPLGEDINELVSRVGTAAQGDRNNTLNDSVFRATALGHRGELVEELFRKAAAESGLEQPGIDATIRSARDAALDSQRSVAEWARLAKRHPELQSLRRFPNVSCIVDALAGVAVLRPIEEGFGISVRQLAELCGVTKDTANKYIKVLVDHDLLMQMRWIDHGKARRFRLKAPRTAKQWDSPPSPPEQMHKDQQLGQGDGGLSRSPAPPAVLDRTLPQLRSHSASLRSADDPHLPPSCAEIMVAVQDGCTSARQIIMVTRRCRETVRGGLRKLLDAGILDFDPTTGELHLTSPTALEGLEEWTCVKGIPDRARWKRDRHASERDAFRKRQDERARRRMRSDEHSDDHDP